MVQELGETSQQMMIDDDQEVQDILNARPKGHYWIVIFHKPTNRVTDKGQRIIIRHVKDYDTRPNNLVGTVILEIKDGEMVDYRLNLPDMPIDWAKVESLAGLIDTPYVQQGTGLKESYFYNY